MNIEDYRYFCLSFQAVTEEMPFGPDTLVFKVCGKMFALTDIDRFESVNLKCDPEKAIALREKYTEVTPGYHMNKKHWVTVKTSGSIGDDLIKAWTTDSYNLVVDSLPLKEKNKLRT
ncbi:MAG: MmcQ/YjbR family DNA-binding protein [Bacteroidales bacterium]|nr:MmcQ/YjbR family DNA-binding protein [Bacteroidales bacterium]